MRLPDLTARPASVGFRDRPSSGTEFDQLLAEWRSLASSARNDEAMLVAARKKLIDELRESALVIGDVTLSSGLRAEYYIDGKRTLLSFDGFLAAGLLVAAVANKVRATAVGGLTIGADPVACGALAFATDFRAFLVRKKRKEHGLQRWIEGPILREGERCLVVDDVVTTGGSVIEAIQHVQDEGLEVAGVVCVLDRLAGGAKAIQEAAAGAPYVPLTTIEDVHPERPDKQAH